MFIRSLPSTKSLLSFFVPTPSSPPLLTFSFTPFYKKQHGKFDDTKTLIKFYFKIYKIF